MRFNLTTIIFLTGMLASVKPSAAATISTFDVLVATGTLITTGTTTVKGDAFSVGGSTFAVNQGFVGIGTAAPVALLNLAGPVINGNGAQFQWIAKDAALRSGEIQGTQWDSTGTYSVAFGFNGKASGNGSVVGGGYYNSATAQQTTVAGGFSNTASGVISTVAGGDVNTANAARSFVGGGYNNLASGPGAAVLGGGQTLAGTAARNTASGTSAAILGGISNTASGDYSAVPGGSNNEASGKYSLAAGQLARASAQGSFVWADSQSGTFTSSNSDEFKIRAQGGFVFVSTPTSSAPTILVSSGAIMISTSAAAASAVPNIFISSVNGNVGIGTMSPAATLAVNGSAEFGSGSTKSTFTATGLLKLTSSGIQWADGSTSTTASSGGGGGATGSGAPFGPQVYTATVTIAGTTVSTGTWQIVASTNPGGASILYFYGLTSNKWYRLSWITAQNGGSSSRDYVQFNGDGGANYKWTATGINTNGGATMLGASNSDTKCMLQGSGNIGNGNEKAGEYTFRTKPNDDTRVIGFHSWAGQDANPFLYNQQGGCFYDGAASLSSLAFGTASGTMTGHVLLEQLMSPLP